MHFFRDLYAKLRALRQYIKAAQELKKLCPEITTSIEVETRTSETAQGLKASHPHFAISMEIRTNPKAALEVNRPCPRLSSNCDSFLYFLVFPHFRRIRSHSEEYATFMLYL